MAKFRLTTEHLYWWPVAIEMPDPDRPGKWTTQSMTMQFASMTSEEARKMSARIAELPTQAERQAAEHDILIACCRDWRDVLDEDGEPLPFSEEALRGALSLVWYRVGIYTAFAKSQQSEAGRRGN